VLLIHNTVPKVITYAQIMSDRKSSISFKKSYCDYMMYINKDKIGECAFTFNPDTPHTIYVTYLFIYESYRGMGCGTVLLYEVLNDAYVVHGKTRVELSDVSDRYGRPDNIYVHMGLVYESIPTDDAMVGNLRHILFGMKKIRHKKQNTFFSIAQ